MGNIGDAAFSRGDIMRELREMKREIRELKAARTLENATIGQGGLRVKGGRISILDDGSLVLTSPNGVNVVFVGSVEGKHQLRLRRDISGNSVLTTRTHSNEVDFWALWDNGGRIVMSDDAESGHGLGRPYLNMTMVPSFDAQQSGTGAGSLWASTDSGTPTQLLNGFNPIWHPKLDIGVAMAGAGGTGHWRLVINDVIVLSDETTGGLRTVSIPGWGSDITPGQDVNIQVFGWVTSGPGRVFLQVDRLYGRQS